MADTSLSSRDRRGILYAVAGLVVAIALLWGAAYAFAGDGVPGGTTVQGVAIGGLSRDQAVARLEQRLGASTRTPVELVAGDARVRVVPAEAGLRLDAPATVAAAGGRSWNPVDLVHGLLGGQAVAPVLAVDAAALDQAATDAAARLSVPARDGGISFTAAGPQAVTPRSGREVSAEDVAAALRSAVPTRAATPPPVQVPARTVAPAVTAAEVDRALREFARPATSGPVTLVTAAGARASVPAALVTPALSMRPDGHGRLVPHLDPAALRRSLGDRLHPLEPAPRDATLRLVGDRAEVVPAQVGRHLRDEALASGVLTALTATGRTTAPIALDETAPKVTTEALTSLGVRDLVSSFTTYFPHASGAMANYRNVNIGRAAQLIDGTLLKPGETFSLNDTVGERTKANGFTEGYIILNGRFETDLGGGVSQVATTTFNAAFFAGLEDVEHHPHSLYISRYPEGREATVAWGAKDLRFRNNTPYAVLIDTELSRSAPGRQGSVTVRMFSTKQWDVRAVKSERYRVRPFPTVYDTSATCHADSGGIGFDVDVTRILSRDGAQVRRETMHTRYDPSPHVVCGAAPKATPTPKATATPKPTAKPTATKPAA